MVLALKLPLFENLAPEELKIAVGIEYSNDTNMVSLGYLLIRSTPFNARSWSENYRCEKF